MNVQFDQTGTTVGLEELVKQILEQENTASIFLLAGDGNKFTPETVDSILKKIQVPIFGGIFPEIIYKNDNFNQGTLGIGFPVAPQNMAVIPNLSNPRARYEEIIYQTIPTAFESNTMMVFVDGLSKQIHSFLRGLFSVFGLEFNYMGGGAGSLSFEQKPCLFTNDGLIQDSALLVMFNIGSGVGVNHGWTSIKGPFQVTQANQNIIKTLNNRPAFTVYKEIVETHSGKIFDTENFFELAKFYPFGINKQRARKIVRDPLMLGANNSLICIGEVPSKSYVDILTGNEESLINAARQAKNIAEFEFNSISSSKITLLMDCISRVLFLEDKFSNEIEAVSDLNSTTVGALTIGEIANTGRDYLEFYSKTAVVGILGA